MTDDPATQIPADEKPRFLDKAGNVKRLLWVFYAVCAGAVVYELLRPLGAADGGAEGIHALAERAPGLEFLGSFAIYGFVSCVALVLAGKGLRRLAMRSEDFYDDATGGSD